MPHEALELSLVPITLLFWPANLRGPRRHVGRRPGPQETWEYVLGATAHLLAQMGDQQASLLLEDVEGLDMESEHRGLMEKDPWGMGEGDGSLYARNSNVYYLNVEPFLQPRFTPEVLQRIMPVMRSIAQRTRLPYLEFLDARPALPNIDTKTWREALPAVCQRGCHQLGAQGAVGPEVSCGRWSDLHQC